MSPQQFNALNHKLDQVYNECSIPNYDGYGAEPIKMEALMQAKVFLQQMPRNIPEPDAFSDPRGGIALEWYKNRYNLYNIVFDGSDKITFVGCFGPDLNVHGEERSPEVIVKHIQLLYEESN